jgi:hypothetical protein
VEKRIILLFGAFLVQSLSILNDYLLALNQSSFQTHGGKTPKHHGQVVIDQLGCKNCDAIRLL